MSRRRDPLWKLMLGFVLVATLYILGYERNYF